MEGVKGAQGPAHRVNRAKVIALYSIAASMCRTCARIGGAIYLHPCREDGRKKHAKTFFTFPPGIFDRPSREVEGIDTFFSGCRR